ncbi:MAG: DUF2497 domain-containing protein [Candidatus Devosia symbiotica]|nr:DUF2497 domain-containing protein [Candidatus Devosia symbiotica]
MEAAPVRPSDDSVGRDLSDMLDNIEPLTLSSSQIIGDGDAADDIGGFSFDSILADTPVEEESTVAAPALVDPEDISFAASAADDKAHARPAPEPESLLADSDLDIAALNSEPEPGVDIIAFDPEPDDEPAFDPEVVMVSAARLQPSIVQAPSMPNASLSSDTASQLLEPIIQAAVRSSMIKFSDLGFGNTNATIESLVRDMLRPMLKEWLDENLPAVVERMVEKRKLPAWRAANRPF